MTVDITTPAPDRRDLARVFTDPKLLRQIEQLLRDVRGAIPTGINDVDAKAQQALDDADAAMIAANNAQADADAANAEIAVINSKLPWPNLVFVATPDDLPTAVAGVRTLIANYTYFIVSTIDLAGDRIVASQNTTIIGGSSENCRIKSTGLIGVALITSAWSLPIRNVTIEADVALSLNALGNPDQAIDWLGVNFTGCGTVGTIANYSNVIWTDCAMLNSAGLTFTGTIGTIGFSQTLFSGVAAKTTITLDASANITRRFRIIYSALSTPATGTAIDVNAAATIPTESYILDTCNFSGAGTYITGTTETSNKALFVNCKGITNTSVNGQMYMQANATATTVAATSTFYKVAGTTTASADNAKFSHSSNRLTCDAVIRRRFLVICTLSFDSGNNNVCEFGLYDSTAAAVRTPSRVRATANGSGRAESVTFQDVLYLESTNYIEVHASNTTAANNITVTDMNVTVTEF